MKARVRVSPLTLMQDVLFGHITLWFIEVSSSKAAFSKWDCWRTSCAVSLSALHEWPQWPLFTESYIVGYKKKSIHQPLLELLVASQSSSAGGVCRLSTHNRTSTWEMFQLRFSIESPLSLTRSPASWPFPPFWSSHLSLWEAQWHRQLGLPPHGDVAVVLKLLLQLQALLVSVHHPVLVLSACLAAWITQNNCYLVKHECEWLSECGWIGVSSRQ